LGSPKPPSDAQRAALVRASGLASEALPAVVVKAGKTDLRLSVPRQGVALVTMSAGKP
jgi:hypothetical protein